MGLLGPSEFGDNVCPVVAMLSCRLGCCGVAQRNQMNGLWHMLIFCRHTFTHGSFYSKLSFPLFSPLI